jgi:multiple sugar transport system substrate-binding protein
MLGGTAAGMAAFLLAACGGAASPTSAPVPTATRPASAPTTAPASGAGATATSSGPAGAAVSSSATAARGTATAARGTATAASSGGGTTVSAGSGPLAPNTNATAFQGKRLAYFQKVQYYKAVQDQIGNSIRDYTKLVGGDVELSVASTDAAQNLAKIQAGVQSGSPFDLADDIGAGIGQLVTLNLLEDVTDVVTQLTAAYGTPMPIIPRGLTKDGKYYAIPYFSSSDAWFLRKDKLTEKGIKPESLDTYEKLRDAALEISDPSKNFFGWGHSPYAVGDGPTLIFHVVHSWGGSLQDRTGTKVVFNSPETVAGVTWLADIYTNPKYKNMLPTGYESWDGAGNNTAFLNGTIGMTSNAFTMYAKAKDDKNPVFPNTFVASRPKGPATASGALTGGQLGYLAIHRGAKNAAMAKETAKYLMQPEQWNKVATQAGGLILPAYESQWKNDFWKSDPNFAQLESQVRDPNGYNQSYYPGPVNPALDAAIAAKVLETMMAAIIQKGQKPADAVKEAHDQMVKVFDQFGIKQ